MTSGIIEISFTSLIISICTLLVGVLFLVAKYYNSTIRESINNLKKEIEKDKGNQKENSEKDRIIFENELERRVEKKIEDLRASILRHFEKNVETQNKMMKNLFKRLDSVNPKLLEQIILEEFDQ